jgi:hypothetical protein
MFLPVALRTLWRFPGIARSDLRFRECAPDRFDDQPGIPSEANKNSSSVSQTHHHAGVVTANLFRPELYLLRQSHLLHQLSKPWVGT